MLVPPNYSIIANSSFLNVKIFHFHMVSYFQLNHKKEKITGISGQYRSWQIMNKTFLFAVCFIPNLEKTCAKTCCP